MVYLAAPKTASKATKEAIRPFGFEKVKGHHTVFETHPGPDWTVFSTVRNPWDVWVSWFFFSGPRGLPFGIEWIDRWRDQQSKYYPDPNSLFGLYAGQSDVVLRFEHLQTDLNGLFGHEVPIPRVNVGPVRKERHYSQFYDDATRDHVATVYAEEIEKYGYEFQSR